MLHSAIMRIDIWQNIMINIFRIEANTYAID